MSISKPANTAITSRGITHENTHTHPKPTPTLGIVGCGAIGQSILGAVSQGKLAVSVAGVHTRTPDKAREFLSRLPQPPPLLDLDALISRSSLVVEAAGGPMVLELARRCFSAGKDLLVISVGALLEHPEVFEQARTSGCRLILPSGAIAGIDGVKSACAGRVDRVSVTTRKPPRGLAGAPYLVQHGISLENLTEETEVFNGTVREGCRGFPDNVNVTATVSLAGIGPDRTRLRILAVPGQTHNQHTVEVEGEFGYFSLTIRNVPTENPKTGRLTAMSMIRAIADSMDSVRVGN